MSGLPAFPIVGIGASAGGIEALQNFFPPLGDSPGLAIVIVTHLSPRRESLLHEVVGRFTTLPVLVAEDGQPIEPDKVYVMPGNAVLGVEGGRLRLRKPAGPQRERNPIDLFFSDLAIVAQDHAVGIVLSGGGSDGTLGIKAIKERGGLTFAQGSDGTKPLHPDMPASAAATGLVDFVLPVGEIGDRLIAHARSLENPDGHATGETGADPETVASVRSEIYAILRSRIGHDFSGYKNKTFMRRVQRRMQVLQVSTLDRYVELLRRSGDEVVTLFRDLLINVTTFFRDSDAFEALTASVIPKIFERRGVEDTVRVWVPGCATGEEVFSVAMLIREHMDALASPPRVQIFATDIDDPALAVARAGRYPEALLDPVSPERRRRFFVQDGSTWAVTKELRELCIFSPHSVIRDPPFSRIDLVSCRNLLIYFGPEVQSQVIPIFHYSLRRGGYLFLGTSENISQYADLFATIDKKQRIFQARDIERGGLLTSISLALNDVRPAPFTRGSFERGTSPRAPGAAVGLGIRQTVEQQVLERFAPAHVVVTQDGDIVHYSGRTGKYLEASPGLPSRQLLTMARMGLRLELRTALREAIDTRRTVSREHLAVEGEEGRVQMVAITVDPLPQTGDGESLLLVLFRDIGPSLTREEAQSGSTLHDPDATVLQLEADLRDSRERLQSVIEEYETALEELKSSNEELVSVNEELQSTNEELEVSKEELQSLNEELQTVNVELSSKLDELDRANGDLRNLFDSTQIATAFLDRELIIRSFTPAVSQFFPIVPTDRGRKLTDFAGRLDHPDLTDDLLEVIATGTAKERRLDQRGGHGDRDRLQVLVRLRPYRETDGSITGVVATFVDVTTLVSGDGRG